MTDVTRQVPAARPISVPGYFVLGALTMITPLATNLFVPALPAIAAAFGSTASEAQLTVSATLVGIAFGQLVIGRISDRIGRRLPALIGTASFIVLSILCALAPDLPVLIVLRFLQGFAGASGVVLSRASIRDRTSGSRAAQALSRLLVVAAIAPVIGPFLGALALQVIDWHGVFVVLAAMGAIAFLLALRWFPESWHRHTVTAAEREEHAAARRALYRDPQFWGMVAVAGFLGLISFSWLSTGSFFLSSQYGVSPTAYALILGASSLGFLLSAWINSRAVLRIGARRALVRGLVIVTASAIVLLVTTIVHGPLVIIVVSSVLAVSAFGGMVANAQAIAMNPHGQAAGTASAFLGSAQFLLGAIVPPIVTALFGATWSMGATMVVSALLALALTVALTRRRRAVVDAPPDPTALA